MNIELSSYHQEFIINLFKNNGLLSSVIKKLSLLSTVHPECDEYIECKVTLDELEELVGELSFEANHNRSKKISEQACEAADSLENQLMSRDWAE